MPPEAPDEWLPILAKRLDNRQYRISRLRSYSNGHAPLPEMRKNLRASWESFQQKSRTNFGGLAVETVASRIIPLGVMVGDEDDTREVAAARRIWRDNRMRQQIHAAVRDRLTTSIGYLVVGLDDQKRAVVTREAPEEFISDVDPLVPWKSRAALKVWRDRTFESDYALVWADGQRQKYVRPAKSDGRLQATATGRWERDGEPEVYGGSPPVVTLERLDGLGLFESHTDLIDRINLGKLQRLVIAAMQAFKQRAIKPKDSQSGALPREDQDGNQIDWGSILEPAPGALWDLPVPIDIWESQAVDIRPLLDGERADARDFAAVLRLPISVFTPEGANQSATGADVTREGLISTAQDEIDSITTGIEVALVYALQAEGTDIGDQTVSVQWEPTEWVSLNEKYAAAQQAKAAGLARRTVLRDIIGMSPEQIRQDEADLAAEKLSDLFTVDDEPTPQESSRSDAIST